MYRYEYLLIYVLIGLLNNKKTIVQSFNMQQHSNDDNSKLQDLINDLTQKQSHLNDREHQLNAATHQLEEDKRQIQQLVTPHDLIRLNVGGQILVTRRQTLTKVPNSLLAAAFSGSYNRILQPDYDGSYFLDYNPLLFSHLLDQLRTLRINDTPAFRPPSLILTKPFNKMLRELRLPRPSRSGDDLIALNVGGEKIVTLRKTLTGVPKSNLANLASVSKSIKRDRFGRPFLDYNPNLFRDLLNELRQGKQVDDIQNLNASSIESKDAFQAMLIDLGVPATTLASTTQTETPRKGTASKTKMPKSESTNSDKKLINNAKKVPNKKKSGTGTNRRPKRDLPLDQDKTDLMNNPSLDMSESESFTEDFDVLDQD